MLMADIVSNGLAWNYLEITKENIFFTELL